MALALLADWDNFYVIAGGAAGGLTGLTFVVIALATDSQRVDVADVPAFTTGLRTFMTPTIVHFGAVLTLSAFLCMPRQTMLSVSLGIGAQGIAGLLYMGSIASEIRHRPGNYIPVREDWWWNVVLPSLSYGALLVMASLIWKRPEASLYGIAAASLLLLFVGIHNAWDIAVWMSLPKREALEKKKDEPS
jgi:hypothetical protein